MALFDDASLVVTPNGYKAGTLYSIKPTSGLGDMTVVRATTATRVNSAGLIESVANNVPRLDYSNGSCPSLLVEPQRSNIVLYSEQFDNAAWTATNASVTSNVIISPSGVQDADLLQSIDTNAPRIRQTTTQTGNDVFTFSCFAKKGNVNFLILRNIAVNVGGGSRAWFNLDTGVIGTVNSGLTASIESVGSGWYRCSISGTTDSSPLNFIDIALSATDNTFAGAASENIYLWGAQLELGSYPTSYIPTTSAAVTRNADVIYKTGISSLIGTSEGSAYFNGNISDQGTGSAVFFEIVNGTSTTNTIVLYINTANGRVALYLGTVGLTPYLSSTSKQGQNVKIAFRWKANDYAFYLDGTQVYTNTSAAAPSGMNTLRVGNNRDGTDIGKNLVNQVVLFPTALTNAELASLTT